MPAVLLFLSILLAALLIFPQTPSDPEAASRWLAQIQAQFGARVTLLQTLGLFAIGRSPLFRVLLALLAFLLLVRSVAWAERLSRGQRATPGEGEWQALASQDLEQTASQLRRRRYRVRPVPEGNGLQADRWPWAELGATLAHVGPLVLLLGLLVGQVTGWREEQLMAAPGETVSLPGRREITVDDGATTPRFDPFAVRIYVGGMGPEVMVSATDSRGGSLEVQRSPEAAPVSRLTLRLTEQDTDAYFAIPDAELVVRITADPEVALEADAPLQIQIFRSPSGSLIQEAVLEEDMDLSQGDTDIHFLRGHYLIFTAAYDPALWLKVTGVIIAALALLAQGIWPPRRLWVRSNGSDLVGVGDLPPGLLADSEDGDPWRRVVRALGGVVALGVGAAAVVSLVRSGLLWDGWSIQLVLTVLWTIGVAVWEMWTRGGTSHGEAREVR